MYLATTPNLLINVPRNQAVIVYKFDATEIDHTIHVLTDYGASTTQNVLRRSDSERQISSRLHVTIVNAACLCLSIHVVINQIAG